MILERSAPGALNDAVGVADAIGAAHPDAESFNVAAGVVDQVQPDAPGIASEPRNHHLAPVNPQGALLVRELTPDLEREGAGVGGLSRGIVAAADGDVETKPRRGGLDHRIQEIATRQQVHNLSGDRRAVIDHCEIGDRGQIDGREGFEGLQHGAEVRGVRRIDLQHRIGAISEGLGGRECRLSGREVVPVFRLGLPGEAPAVGDDPWCARRRSHSSARRDARRRQRLARRQVRVGQRARRETDL